MPFIVKIKQTDKYRLFGSLPILCKVLNFDDKIRKSLSYTFSQKKDNVFENDDVKIIRVSLERTVRVNSH